jgi:hypothetical protein
LESFRGRKERPKRALRGLQKPLWRILCHLKRHTENPPIFHRLCANKGNQHDPEWSQEGTKMGQRRDKGTTSVHERA